LHSSRIVFDLHLSLQASSRRHTPKGYSQESFHPNIIVSKKAFAIRIDFCVARKKKIPP